MTSGRDQEMRRLNLIGGDLRWQLARRTRTARVQAVLDLDDLSRTDRDQMRPGRVHEDLAAVLLVAGQAPAEAGRRRAGRRQDAVRPAAATARHATAGQVLTGQKILTQGGTARTGGPRIAVAGPGRIKMAPTVTGLAVAGHPQAAEPVTMATAGARHHATALLGQVARAELVPPTAGHAVRARARAAHAMAAHVIRDLGMTVPLVPTGHALTGHDLAAPVLTADVPTAHVLTAHVLTAAVPLVRTGHALTGHGRAADVPTAHVLTAAVPLVPTGHALTGHALTGSGLTGHGLAAPVLTADVSTAHAPTTDALRIHVLRARVPRAHVLVDPVTTTLVATSPAIPALAVPGPVTAGPVTTGRPPGGRGMAARVTAMTAEPRRVPEPATTPGLTATGPEAVLASEIRLGLVAAPVPGAARVAPTRTVDTVTGRPGRGRRSHQVVRRYRRASRPISSTRTRERN